MGLLLAELLLWYFPLSLVCIYEARRRLFNAADPIPRDAWARSMLAEAEAAYTTKFELPRYTTLERFSLVTNA
jgi:hypothetical protein